MCIREEEERRGREIIHLNKINELFFSDFSFQAPEL